VVALAGNLHFLRSCFFTGLTAVLVASLRDALAWQMRTLDLFIRHKSFSFFGCSSFLLKDWDGRYSLSPQIFQWFMVLDPSENQQNDNDKKNQSQAAGRGIAPLAAMRPAWQRTNQG
jgi:hypothetical protein